MPNKSDSLCTKPYVKQRYILPYDSCAGSVDMQKEAIFKNINRNVNSSIRKKRNRLSLSLKKFN